MDPALQEALHPYVVALAAVVGLLIGSFLNVVIARVPAGRSIVRPRSACPACGAQIAWYDNVPVVSWLLLRARCRRCGAPISWRYPAVELAVCAVAIAAVERRGLTLAALFEFAYVATLLALAAIDLDTWLLPHALTRPLIAVGLVAGLLHVPPARTFGRAATGALVGFGVLWVVAWLGRLALKKEAMGGGDVWLLSALGAWNGTSALLPILLLASLQGSLVGVALILAGRAQPGPAPPAPVPEPAGPPPDAANPPDPAAAAPTIGGPPLDSAPPAAIEPDAQGAPQPRDDEEDWVPPANAVPFGPFLVAAALEWLYLSGALVRLVPALRMFR